MPIYKLPNHPITVHSGSQPGMRNPMDKALNQSLNISPESRAHPRAPQQGCTNCRGTSPCKRFYKEFGGRRIIIKKKYICINLTKICFQLLMKIWDSVYIYNQLQFYTHFQYFKLKKPVRVQNSSEIHSKGCIATVLPTEPSLPVGKYFSIRWYGSGVQTARQAQLLDSILLLYFRKNFKKVA